MERNAKDILPAIATHPGRLLLAELHERGINIADFADLSGISFPSIKEFVKGEKNVTEELAFKLEKAIKIPSSIWIKLQSRYDYIVTQKQNQYEIKAPLRQISRSHTGNYNFSGAL